MRVSDISPAHDTIIAAGHGVFGAAVVATLMGWLPPIAAILSIFWFAYQIYDMWDRRHRRRLAALNSKRRATDV